MKAGKSFGFKTVIALGREDPSLGPEYPVPSSLSFALLPPPVPPQFRGQDEDNVKPADNDETKEIRRAVSPARTAQCVISELKNRFVTLLLPIKLARHSQRLFESQMNLNDVELIQVHDFFMLFAGTRIKRLTGARLIYDAHELESRTTGLSALGGFFVSWWERVLWRSVDGFITVSEGIRQHYLARHRNVPSAVILNSPEFSPSHTGKAPQFGSVRERLNLDADQTLFVYLGALSEGRGIETTVETFRSLPTHLHCVFIGEGDLEAYLTHQAKQARNIHILPPVPHNEVVPFISSADFGLCLIEPVSLSYSFALPNKLFECLFAGLPVLGSDLPEIRRVIEEHSAGVVTSLHSEEIRTAALELAQTPQKIDSSTLSALSWESQVAKLHFLYGTLRSP